MSFRTNDTAADTSHRNNFVFQFWEKSTCVCIRSVYNYRRLNGSTRCHNCPSPVTVDVIGYRLNGGVALEVDVMLHGVPEHVHYKFVRVQVTSSMAKTAFGSLDTRYLRSH